MARVGSRNTGGLFLKKGSDRVTRMNNVKAGVVRYASAVGLSAWQARGGDPPVGGTHLRRVFPRRDHPGHLQWLWAGVARHRAFHADARVFFHSAGLFVRHRIRRPHPPGRVSPRRRCSRIGERGPEARAECRPTRVALDDSIRGTPRSATSSTGPCSWVRTRRKRRGKCWSTQHGLWERSRCWPSGRRTRNPDLRGRPVAGSMSSPGIVPRI